MKVHDILKNKGPEVYTIGEDKLLSQAVKVLTINNIGALLVLNKDGKIAGIITERDILHICNNNPKNWENSVVKDSMTKEIIIVEPNDDIDYVESIMTENRVRHLPVLNNKVLVGIISIGDVVKALLNDSMHENKYLRDYISGNIRI